MLLYLGGQTIFDHENNSVVLYLGSISFKENKIRETVFSIFNGKDLVNVDGSGLGHIFDRNPHEMLRSMYYGDFCNFSMTDGLDEDKIPKIKRNISKHLKAVELEIKEKKLFIKEFVGDD